MPLSKNLGVRLRLENLNMEFMPIKKQRLGTEWKYENVISPFSRIYVPTAGEGYLDYRGGRVMLTPGKIYLIPAMLKFSYGCDSCLEKFFTHVSASKPNGFDALAEVGDILVIEERGEAAALASLTERDGIGGSIETGALVLAIISRATREHGIVLGNAEIYSDVTRAAIEYVNSHLLASLKISEIADAVYTSRLTLQRKFKDDVGIPIGKYIDERLIIRAENELLSGRQIAEVAERLGFSDRFYFTRRFTDRFGIPPAKYLRMMNLPSKSTEKVGK